MPPTITSALAPTFTHTAAIADFTLTFSAGVSPVTGTLTSGDYRMWLAPLTSCYLRQLASAMKAAINIARSSGAGVVASLSSSGVITFTFQVDVPATVTLAAPMWQLLGFSSATPTVTAGAITGTRPVWHLATFIERVSNDWAQRTPIAAAETIAGIGYGITSGSTTWVDEIAYGFIPRDPTFRAALGLYQTAWFPADAYLTTPNVAAAREYSISDLLTASLGRTVGYANGTLQTLFAETSTTFDLVTIPGAEISSPRVVRLRQGWDAYRRWTTRLIRQSTPTGSIS